jgi:sugar transferase (PEP-CTERM system associated)
VIRFFNTFFPSRTVFLGISEACLVTVAFLAAMLARLGTNDAYVMLNYEQGFLKIIVVSGTFVLCMYYFDLYDSSILSNRREVLTRVVQVLGTVSILLAVLYYVYPPLQLGRGIFLIGFVLVSMLLLCWRRLFLLINSLPSFADRAIILGDGPLAGLLLSELDSRPELGLRVVAHIPEGANGDHLPSERNGILSPEGLAHCVETQRVNRIIVAMDDRRGKLPVECLLSMKSRGVLIQDGPQVYEAITGKMPTESLRPGWLLFSEGFLVSRSLLFYGRFLSCLVSAVGIVLSLPLIPFIVLGIKLTSPGPILYWQKRVGLDGKVFPCCKFRSMRVDAEAGIGPTWAIQNDPRVTPVGRFLRSSRLDEIPQLWMVLKGDMNLIGPRPERPEFVERLTRRIPFYHLRHTIRPGITGWAQIRYKYGSSVDDAKEKLKYDLFYVKNMSPGLDLIILFHSIKIVLLGRGAK